MRLPAYDLEALPDILGRAKKRFQLRKRAGGSNAVRRTLNFKNLGVPACGGCEHAWAPAAWCLEQYRPTRDGTARGEDSRRCPKGSNEVQHLWLRQMTETA